MIAWHGTTKEELKSIKKKGLVPHGAPGADQWAFEKNGTKLSAEGSRARSVYLTTSRSIASGFSYIAAEERQQTPILLKLELPAEVEEGLHLDEDAAGWEFFRYEGTVKPEWIVGEEKPAPTSKVDFYDKGKRIA